MSPGSQPTSHPPGTIAAGVQIVPEYCLEKLLGKGGFGEVWKAIGPGKVPAALKIILVKDSEAGQREFRSLDLLRDLRHPNLLPIQGYWLLDDAGQVIHDDRPPSTLVIAMLLGGKNLRQRLSECQKSGFLGIPPDELLEYMRDAAKGIDFLNRPVHKHGDRLVAIQHRDIKPQNLMIVGGGLMVADFGIAGVMESTHVHTDHAAMTYAYAAPELFDHSASAWTDQYALAITYSQLRTGRLPFADKSSSMQIMTVHMEGTHDFAGLTSAEIEVLKRATARIPEKRFANCMELVSHLEAAVQAADSAPTVHLARGSALRAPSSGTEVAEVEGTAPFTPSQADFQHPTKDSTRVKTIPELPKKAGGRSWLLGGSIAGLIALCGLVAGLVAWQQGVFSPKPKEITKVEGGGSATQGGNSTGNSNQGTKPVTSDEGNEVPVEIKPKVPKLETPSLEDKLRAARQRAAEAQREGLYAEVAPALEPVFEAQAQKPEDYSLRGKARLALADAGTTPETNYEQAAEDFAAAMLSRDEGKAWAKLGGWLLEQERPKEAIPHLLRAAKLQREQKSPALPALLLQLCSAHLAAHDWTAAYQEATASLLELKVENSNPEVAARLHFAAAQASLALANGPPPSPKVEEWDQHAERHLRQAIALATKAQLDDLAHLQSELSAFRKLPRVIAREEMRRDELRIAELTKELQNLPGDWQRHLELAELEQKLGREKPAKGHFARGFSHKAIELMLEGKLEDAEKAGVEAAKHDDETAIVPFARGMLSMKRGSNKEALSLFDVAVQRTTKDDPERWQILGTRGEVLLLLDTNKDVPQAFSRARDDFDAAIAAYPNSAALAAVRPTTPITDAHRSLAKLYCGQGFALEGLALLELKSDPAILKQAGQSLRMAAALNPEEPRFALLAGGNLLRQSRLAAASEAAQLLEDAAKLVTKSVDLDPQRPNAHNVLGECLMLKKQVAAAQAEFEQAVKLGQKEPAAMQFEFNLNLCYSYLRQPRNDEKALAAAERAIALQVKSPEGHFVRGLALRNMGKNSEAIAAFDDALAQQPEHVDSLLAKSQLVIEREKSTAAQIAQADRDIETAFSAATTDARKAEAHYVRSLSSLRHHLASVADPEKAELALLKTQRDLLQGVTLVPANGIYVSAAADLFDFAAKYTWRDAQRKAENNKLQQDWMKLKKTLSTK